MAFMRVTQPHFGESVFISRRRVWKGIFYVSQDHLYILFHRIARAFETGLVISSIPTEDYIMSAGIVLTLERRDDRNRLIGTMPAVATLWFGRKLADSEIEAHPWFPPIAKKVLAGEMPTEQDADHVRELEQPYLNAASLMKSEEQLARAVRNVKVGDHDLRNLDDLFNFVPFSVG